MWSPFRRSPAANLRARPMDRALEAVLTRRPGGVIARRWRRIAALLLLLAAGALAVRGAPAPDPGSPMLRLTADLPIGAVLEAGDLEVVQGKPPDGALTAVADATGRVLASPARRGEVLTDVRLLATDGPDPGPGRVAVPVTLSDAAMGALLRPGMQVVVVGMPEEGPVTALTEAIVLTVTDLGGYRGIAVVIAVPEAAADAVTQAGISNSVTFRF